jgi:very-short-patch-repair endonuclease
MDERQRAYVAAESLLELRVAKLLEEAGLPEPVRQFEVREGGRLLARVDFAYPQARVAIEADGYRFHSGRADWQREHRTQNALVTRGWLVIRVTWEDVEFRPDEFISEVGPRWHSALHEPRIAQRS